MNRAGGQLVPGVSTPPTMQHRTGDSWRLKFDLPPVRHGQKTNHDMEDMIGGCIYIGSRGCLREANLFARIVNWRIALSQLHCSVTVFSVCFLWSGVCLSIPAIFITYICTPKWHLPCTNNTLGILKDPWLFSRKICSDTRRNACHARLRLWLA